MAKKEFMKIQKILQELFEERGISLAKIVLFGSYATGKYTVGSDIDLLIVYKGETRPDAYAITKRSLDIPRLEPHLYSEVEYREMKETINRMEEGGIVLISGEEN